MPVERENLQESYKLFIEQDHALSFFKGLNGYIEYALSTAPFSHLFSEQMSLYDAGNKKIEELENRALKEAVSIMDDLKAIVRKKRLDVSTFKRFHSWQFNNTTTIYEEFESYLKGRSVGNGFPSDSLHHYLFDIAANLLVLGHKKEVQKYLASEEEYAAYYARINGAGSSMITGNVHGSFLFGSAWPERWEYGAKLEAERTLKPWGSFVELYLFKQAYETVSDHKDRWQLLQDDGTEHNRFRTHDRVDVVNMVRELQSLVADEAMLSVYRGISNVADAKVRKLISELKPHVQAVHNFLLKAGSSVRSATADRTLGFDEGNSTLSFSGAKIEISKSKNSDPHYLLTIMFRDPKKTWAMDEIWEDELFKRRGKRFNPKTDWRKIYNAAYSTNEKVQKTTTISDFLEVTKTSVAIKRLYIS